MGRGIKETTLEILILKLRFGTVPMVSLDHAEVELLQVDLWESFDRCWTSLQFIN
jgi:hypothetical protein